MHPPPGMMAPQSGEVISGHAGSAPFIPESATSRVSNICCKSVSSSRLFHDSDDTEGAGGVEPTTDDDEVQSRWRPRESGQTLTDLARLYPNDPSFDVEESSLAHLLWKPRPRHVEIASTSKAARSGVQKLCEKNMILLCLVMKLNKSVSVPE